MDSNPEKHRRQPGIAAFAAMAEHLARRDGWATPGWARLPEREAWPWWFVTDIRGLHPEALVEPPSSFPPPRCLHHRRSAEARMKAGLGREDTRTLLDDPSEELKARGARAELFLVGGAALAVAYDATRSTLDIDAVFIPSDIVRQAATSVTQRSGLAEDWLNDAVKGFLPGPGPDAQRSYSSGSLIVDVASPPVPARDETIRRPRRNRRWRHPAPLQPARLHHRGRGAGPRRAGVPRSPIPVKVRFLLTEILDSAHA